jgi:hypothetical protein
VAFDITGITNENEFYTHHYLSAILENDLKGVFGEWKHKEDEEGVAQPYKRLRGLRKEFFAKQGLLEREKNIEARLSLQREFIAQLLSVLGYDYHNQTVEPDDHGSIPLAGGISYRLAGRDREKSASYYTPEVLTQCLVKYALKELLKDKTADEILELTVCEPAMGSAAFLNEAVSQLSKAYLDLKQKETGQTISHDDYPKELQKVRSTSLKNYPMPSTNFGSGMRRCNGILIIERPIRFTFSASKSQRIIGSQRLPNLRTESYSRRCFPKMYGIQAHTDG